MGLPAAIIFVNSDLTEQVKGVLKKQLFINEEYSDTEFDLLVTSDPAYTSKIKSQGKRILVIRADLQDYTNRDLADIVIFIKMGLARIEKNNYGPPELTLPVTGLYIHKLMRWNGLI